MSFWTALEGIAKNVLARVEPVALTFFAALASAITPELKHLAQDAVVAAEQQGGTGEEKFSAAKALVLGELGPDAIAIGLNAIHGAIEGAVANLKLEPAIADPTNLAAAQAMLAGTLGGLGQPVSGASVVNTTASLRATGGDLGSVANQAAETIDGGGLGADSVSG